MNKYMVSAIIVLIAAALFSSQAGAQQEPRIQVGTLTCRLAPSVGVMVASRQRMDCRFVRSDGGRPERYAGVATRIGLDFGVTAGGVMIWRVLTRTSRPGRGVLAGHFVGASGDIALGVGVGANALIGGSRRSVMLQPLSVSGQVGVNIALGVAGLELRFRG